MKKMEHVEKYPGKVEISSFRDLLTFFKDNHDRYLRDGLYDVTEIEIFEVLNLIKLPEGFYRHLSDFINEHPNWVYANPYDTEQMWILSERPIEKVRFRGSGFNHGSSNLIENCPSRILILGEND